MKIYVIIGGGASGIASAIQLIRCAKNDPSKILLIEKNASGNGTAFSTKSSAHLLNIQAQFMSINMDEPSHFLDWVRKMDPQIQPDSFVLRKTYGDYLKHILQELESHSMFEKIHSEAVALDKTGEKFFVTMSNGRKIEADSVILATGNFPPPPLPVPNGNALASPNYIRDPWEKPLNIHPDESVFIVGTGLTMVDQVLELCRQGHRGKIFALSRHGFLPTPHHQLTRWPQEIKDPPKQIHILFKELRKKIGSANDLGEKIAILQDYLWFFRTHWKTFSAFELERFNRHLHQYYAVFVHTNPISSFETIQRAKNSSQLTIHAGRLQKIIESKADFEITFRLRGQDSTQTIAAQHLINCLAPAKTFEEVSDPFLHDLLKKGFVTPTAKGFICETKDVIFPVGKNGNVTKGLYIIGALRKTEWSTTGFVPAIAYYAKKLAECIA